MSPTAEHLQRPAALQLQQAAGMSTQALQQRQQTLRLQRLQVERERLKLRQRMVMNQVRVQTGPWMSVVK